MSLQARSRSSGTAVRQKKPIACGCTCTPDPASGKCCATNRCGCRKKGDSGSGGYCSAACQCHRPLCACDGGNHTAIELTVKKEGPNKGRKFYKCRKRDGGCNYFQWATAPLIENKGRRLGDVTNQDSGIIDLVSEDEDDMVIRNANSNPQGYFVSPCVNQFGCRGSDPTLPIRMKSGSGISGSTPGQMRSSNGQKQNGNKKRKQCPRGSACPYQHEYQHGLEFNHSDDNNETPGSGWGSLNKMTRPSRSGATGENHKTFEPFGGKGHKLGSL